MEPVTMTGNGQAGGAMRHAVSADGLGEESPRAREGFGRGGQRAAGWRSESSGCGGKRHEGTAGAANRGSLVRARGLLALSPRHLSLFSGLLDNPNGRKQLQAKSDCAEEAALFVQNLNDRQQCVLLHYADAVMRADNRIDSSELVAIDMLRNQAHPGASPEEVPIDKLGGIFRNRIGRVSFLLELIGIGHVNEDLDPRQSELIERIAEAWDMQADGTLAAASQWVADQLDLMKRARELMGEG